MKTYKELLQRKITLEFNKEALNSYKITNIEPTERFMHEPKGKLRIYICSVDWEKKNMDGTYPRMDFDERTLDELMLKGFSICPMASNIIFRLEDKLKMN